MATIVDITDRKARQSHIAQKNDQLRRLNDELLQFAYSASHDLKAPLASISGLLDFCELDLENGEVQEVTANIKKCKSLSSRLAKRIEDMLNLAKSDMDPAAWQDTNVSAQVETIWSGLDSSDVRLVTDFQHVEQLRTVLVRFSAIVENLLSNAIKFRDVRRKDCSISIKTWTESTHFLMSVEDNGIGIPIEHQDKVFNLFQRVSDTVQPGSGLGLALVKKNLTHLGGTIDLESSHGKTIFTMSLPQADTIEAVTESSNED